MLPTYKKICCQISLMGLIIFIQSDKQCFKIVFSKSIKKNRLCAMLWQKQKFQKFSYDTLLIILKDFFIRSRSPHTIYIWMLNFGHISKSPSKIFFSSSSFCEHRGMNKTKIYIFGLLTCYLEYSLFFLNFNIQPSAHNTHLIL